MFLIYMHFGQNELFLLYTYLLMNKYKNPNQSNTINQSMMVEDREHDRIHEQALSP
jgi:hypothetical protein